MLRSPPSSSTEAVLGKSTCFQIQNKDDLCLQNLHENTFQVQAFALDVTAWPMITVQGSRVPNQDGSIGIEHACIFFWIKLGIAGGPQHFEKWTESCLSLWPPGRLSREICFCSRLSWVGFCLMNSEPAIFLLFPVPQKDRCSLFVLQGLQTHMDHWRGRVAKCSGHG